MAGNDIDAYVMAPAPLTETQIEWLRERRLHPVDRDVAAKNVATSAPVECDVCGRPANQAKQMHHIQLTEFSDKPVVCETCYGTFVRYGVFGVKSELEQPVDMYATGDGGLAVDGVAFSWG